MNIVTIGWGNGGVDPWNFKACFSQLNDGISKSGNAGKRFVTCLGLTQKIFAVTDDINVARPRNGPDSVIVEYLCALPGRIHKGRSTPNWFNFIAMEGTQ